MAGGGANGGGEAARKRPMEDTVTPSVKGQDGIEVFFRTNRNSSILKVLRAYCDKKNMDYKAMRFVYNGERFPVSKTPDELHMVDGDEICAMMHQTGGSCGVPAGKTSA